MSQTPDLTATSENRSLNVWLSGDPDGETIVFHPGTPGPPMPWKDFDDAAERHGLRVVTYARPGYSGSTRHRGRSVADAAADTATVLDALGVGAFITLGHSGGGPHALACGALLPHRCRAVVALASVAPYAESDLEWLDGMAEENVAEFGMTLLGEAEYR
jgi:pimeloyl-ACP methyl ester carboxylesterase